MATLGVKGLTSLTGVFDIDDDVVPLLCHALAYSASYLHLGRSAHFIVSYLNLERTAGKLGSVLDNVHYVRSFLLRLESTKTCTKCRYNLSINRVV